MFFLIQLLLKIFGIKINENESLFKRYVDLHAKVVRIAITRLPIENIVEIEHIYSSMTISEKLLYFLRIILLSINMVFAENIPLSISRKKVKIIVGTGSKSEDTREATLKDNILDLMISSKEGIAWHHLQNKNSRYKSTFDHLVRGCITDCEELFKTLISTGFFLLETGLKFLWDKMLYIHYYLLQMK